MKTALHNQEMFLDIFQSIIEDGINFSQIRAYAGDVLFTEKMAGTQVYLIKEGQVDLYLMREERRVVVESLGKGQCFGMNSSLLNKGRTTNAAAATYSEFYVIDSTTLDQHFRTAPKIVRAILGTFASRIAAFSELVATRINYQPEILVYAQLLQLLGLAEVGGRTADSRGKPNQAVVASVVLTDVFGQARALLGHSDPHIRFIIGKLLSLHLIRIEDENGNGKRVIFSAKEIVLQAKKLSAADREQGKIDYEYVKVEEFAAMVDVDRSTLLAKLAKNEFSEDIFTFRKSEILRLLDTKGKKFFSDRKIKSPEEFVDIEDLEFADQKSIVEVLSKVDSFDLAKVLFKLEDGNAKKKILACLPRMKREEVEADVASLNDVDPIEASQQERQIVQRIKEIMLARK